MHVRWTKRCPACGQMYKLQVTQDRAARVRSSVLLLADYEPSTEDRIFTGFAPWDRLTSGMKLGFTYLLGGNKGIGKSTLTLQLASSINPKFVSMVTSAEEQVSSVGDRAARTHVLEREIRDRRVYVQQTNCTEDLFGAIDLYRPNFFVIDSMQKFMSNRSTIGGTFGSGSQMKYLVDGVRERAFRDRSVALIIGQCRADGHIAGPNMIQHDVDAVLLLTKDTRQPGVVRGKALKNRGGETDVWQTMLMTPSGLEDPTGGEMAVRVSDQLVQESKVVPTSRFMAKLNERAKQAPRALPAPSEQSFPAEEFDDGDELQRDIFDGGPSEELVDDDE